MVWLTKTDNTLIPWRGGKPLIWDVTVCTTVADSYLVKVKVNVAFE